MITSALAVTLTLKIATTTTKIFPHDALARDAASLATKCCAIQKILSGKHSLTFVTFAVTLTLKAIIPFFSTGSSGL